MQADFERLVHEAALRSLDKQERLLEELRARTGLLLAASSVAASFLGQEAFRSTNPVLLRHLTYNLSALWAANDRAIIKLSRAYSVAAGALVAEILSLSALLAATIV